MEWRAHLEPFQVGSENSLRVLARLHKHPLEVCASRLLETQLHEPPAGPDSPVCGIWRTNPDELCDLVQSADTTTWKRPAKCHLVLYLTIHASGRVSAPYKGHRRRVRDEEVSPI